MKRKLSKSTRVLVFFTLTLILSVAGWFMMVSVYGSFYSVIATGKTNVEPERYVLLENPDSYTLEAINNGHSSHFDSFDRINIDELNQANSVQFEHKSFYYKYNNSYYRFEIAYGDKFPPFLLPQILLVGFIASIVAIVVISFYKIGKYVKSKVS